jgi:hypothetical protein
MSNANKNRQRKGPTRLAERLFFFFGWLVIYPSLLALAPIGLAHELWRDGRLRRWYRSAHRLLDWNRSKERILKEGTLIVEIWHFQRVNHLWWLPFDLRTRYTDYPLASARVLEPSFDFKERFMLMTNKVTRAWWESHLQEFSDSVYLVQTPLRGLSRCDELLAAPNALAVSSSWTYEFWKRSTSHSTGR